MIPIPTIGRIIHAVFKDAHDRTVIRPAIIVRVWGETADSAINAQIFCDSNGGRDNDALPNVIWKTSLCHDPGGIVLNSWHWPTKT